MNLSRAETVQAKSHGCPRVVNQGKRCGFGVRKPHRQECLCHSSRNCLAPEGLGGNASEPVAKARTTAIRKADPSPLFAHRVRARVRDDSQRYRGNSQTHPRKNKEPTATATRGTKPCVVAKSLSAAEWRALVKRGLIDGRQTIALGREARGRDARDAVATTGEPTHEALADCVCSFGATRVGPFIERLRLHVTTDRFLAARRGDKMWEAACDYAALALTRLALRLRPTVLAEWICATGAPRRGSATSGLTQRVVAGGRR
jgi:hypothetical protein